MLFRSAPDRFYILLNRTSIIRPTIVTVKAKRVSEKSVLVIWKAAGVLPNSHFHIERSIDGEGYEVIGKSMEANACNEYNFIDNAATVSKCSYRIRTISSGGVEQLSEPANLGGMVENSSVSISPNPVQNRTIHFQLDGIRAGDYTIEVYSSDGRLLKKKTVDWLDGQTSYLLPIQTEVASGFYRVRVVGNKGEIASIQVRIL